VPAAVVTEMMRNGRRRAPLSQSSVSRAWNASLDPITMLVCQRECFNADSSSAAVKLMDGYSGDIEEPRPSAAPLP
jgi:hypothetical protein